MFLMLFRTVVDSNHVQSPIKKSPKLIACKARLDKLVKAMQTDYSKWKLAQDRGTALCYSIEAKRTRCLEKQEEDTYPNEMIMPCEKLALITTMFDDILKNTLRILSQMRAIQQLADSSSDVIFYRTWKLQQFVSFTEDLCKRYERESLVKKIVMGELLPNTKSAFGNSISFIAENLAHCTERSKLISYTTSWEFPEYVDVYVDLVFLLLTEEVRK